MKCTGTLLHGRHRHHTIFVIHWRCVSESIMEMCFIHNVNKIWRQRRMIYSTRSLNTYFSLSQPYSNSKCARLLAILGDNASTVDRSEWQPHCPAGYSFGCHFPDEIQFCGKRCQCRQRYWQKLFQPSVIPRRSTPFFRQRHQRRGQDDSIPQNVGDAITNFSSI